MGKVISDAKRKAGKKAFKKNRAHLAPYAALTKAAYAEYKRSGPTKGNKFMSDPRYKRIKAQLAPKYIK